MDPETFRSIHRGGAVASLAGILLGAVLEIAGGPFASAAPMVLLLSGLGAFYFVGAVLEDRPRTRLLGRELLRGVVWYAGALLVWSMVVADSPTVSATAWTLFLLPVLTALFLTGLMVAIQVRTGLDLRVRSEGGQLLHFVTGSVVVGFLVIYLVLAGGRSPWLFALYAVAEGVGIVIFRRYRASDAAA